MTPQQIQQLIDLVKDASAGLWKAALEQVYAELALDITWIVLAALLLIAGVTFMVRGAKRGLANVNRKNDKTDEERVARQEREWTGWALFVGSLVASVLSTITLLVNLTGAYQLWIAPDYAAIKELVKLVPGQG